MTRLSELVLIAKMSAALDTLPVITSRTVRMLAYTGAGLFPELPNDDPWACTLLDEAALKAQTERRKIVNYVNRVAAA